LIYFSATYRHESTADAVVRRAKTGVIGFGIGSTVGAAAYFLRTQRFAPKPMGGAAAFMGTIMMCGSLVKGWNLH
jgi:hypothetical protein